MASSSAAETRQKLQRPLSARVEESAVPGWRPRHGWVETLVDLRVREIQALEPGGTPLAASGAMRNSDTARILDLLTELSESINGPRPKEPGPKTRRPLSDRVDELDRKVDKLDSRVSEVQLGLATLAADTKGRFQKIDERFHNVDARFDAVDAQFRRIDERFHKVDARFDAVDRQFNNVNQNIAVLRVELVDHMERIHSELTGRIVDLETPGTEGRGGSGSGSGGHGVPLAS
jgi:archaellum component FlaC